MFFINLSQSSRKLILIILQLLNNATVSSSSSSSSSNTNYNASLTTSTSAAVANNNNNNNIHSFVTSLSEGEDNNLNHNPHNNTGQQHFTANGEVGGGTLSIPSTTTSTSLTANDLTNLSNLQVAAAWNQHHPSQHQQNLTTLNVVGQSGTGGMSSSHL